MTGVRMRDLHEKWVQDPEYRAAYDAMEDEFALAAEQIRARTRADEQIRARTRATASQTASAGRVSASETAERIGYYAWSSRPSVIHMTQEKGRISERLARIDAERAKLAEQLNELEITERVLTRFGRVDAAERRQPGRSAARTAPPTGHERRERSGQQMPSVSLTEATLQAIKAHSEGATANDILNHLSRELGMTVRPNHLGIALQRLRRSGQLENRDRRWYLAQRIGSRIERLERSSSRY
jgi:hypothetical protein